MRLHRSEALQSAWYTVDPEVRKFVESLKLDPYPASARAIEERPGRFEDFVSGRWIVWEIDDSGGETVIRVTITQ